MKGIEPWFKVLTSKFDYIEMFFCFQTKFFASRPEEKSDSGCLSEEYSKPIVYTLALTTATYYVL